MKSFKTIFPSICDTIASPTRANKRGGGNLTSSHHFFSFLILTAGLLLCTQGVWGSELPTVAIGTHTMTSAPSSPDSRTFVQMGNVYYARQTSGLSVDQQYGLYIKTNTLLALHTTSAISVHFVIYGSEATGRVDSWDVKSMSSQIFEGIVSGTKQDNGIYTNANTTLATISATSIVNQNVATNKVDLQPGIYGFYPTQHAKDGTYLYQIVVESAGPTPYTGNIYPIGENFTWAWTIGDMPQMTNDGAGHYTWSGWMNGSSDNGFKFLCQKTDNTWYPAFMPKTANQSVTIGTAYDIQKIDNTTDNKFKLTTSGYYTISIDLSDKDNGKMTITNYAPEMRMLYLNPGGSTYWEQDGAKYSVHSWAENDYSKTGDAFLTTTGCSNGQYVAQVPMEHTKVIFIRNKNTASKPGFDDKWNQTANLDIPTNGNNMYTITGWGSNTDVCPGSWGINSVSQYTVTLSKTEGTIVSTPDGWTKGENLTKTVDCGSNVILPALSCMSRTGYNVVDNWFDGSGNAYAAGSVVEVTSNQTFYTHWTAKQVNVTFNANTGKIEGQDTKVLVYTYDGPALTLPTPQKTGYNFMGWFTSSTGGTQINNVGGSNKPLEDVEYFAQWTPKTTDITLNANTDNHGKTASSVTATYGQSLPSFTACTTDETSYSLTGYWTGAVGGTMVIDASGTLVADLSGYTDADGKWAREGDALTLYAQYTIHTCDEYWLFTGETRDNTHFGGKTEGYTGSLGKGVVYPDGKSFQYGMYIAGKETLQSQDAYWQSYIPTNKQVNITVYAYTGTAQDVAIFIGNSTADAVEVKRENVAANTATIVKYSTSNFEIGKTIYVQWMKDWAVFGNIYVEDCVPAPTDPWAVYGNFDGSYKAYLIENGTRTINSLAKETEYEFKITKNNDATIWYTDQNSGTMTENDYGPWNFSKENGANTKILTAAAGDYTFTVNTGGEYPVVSVSYPTSYTVSFVANGGTGTMNPVKHFAPNDSYTIPDCGFTYANMHFTGWKDQNNNDLAVGEQVTITSHLTLTAQWEKAVTGITISAAGGVTELLFGQQCQMTANIEPADATYGTDISWMVVDGRYGSITASGLFTASTTNAGTATIKATSGNGVEATYNMEITSGDCSDWFILAWKKGQDKDKDGAINCFTQVGETNEWRCDYVLPSVADWFYVSNMKGGGNPKDWTFNAITTVGLQRTDNKPYPGQDAIGYLRIFSDYTDENSYIAFQPIYVAMYNTGSEWKQIEFENTTGNEYESSVFQVPVGYKTNNNQYYVGTKRNGTTNTPFVEGKSHTDYLKDVGGLSDADMGGKYGKFHIYDNSSANNWYCQFIRYYQLSYSGEGTEEYNPQYVKSSADDKTITLGQVPAKTGYSPNGWLINGVPYAAGANYTLTDDAVAIAQWTANPYTLTLAVGEHGSAAGSATATYDATALTDITLVTPAAGYTVTGYYSGDTKVLNADGSFAAQNIDGYITEGKWSRAEDCTLTAHYYRDPEEICALLNANGNIKENGTYNFNEFTISIQANDISYHRALIKTSRNDYLIITNPNSFAKTWMLAATGYEDISEYDLIYSPNMDGTSYTTDHIKIPNSYQEYYLTIPDGTKYLRLNPTKGNVGVTKICISEDGYKLVSVGSEDRVEVTSPVDRLILHEGGEITNENLVVKKEMEYRLTFENTDLWKTVALPYNTSVINVWDVEDGLHYGIWPAYGEDGDGAQDGYFFMKNLSETTESTISWQHIIPQYPKANIPYIVSLPSIFTNNYFYKNNIISYVWKTKGKDPTLELSQTEIETELFVQASERTGFKLCANPNLQSVTIEDEEAVYILTDDGTCFDLVYGATIKPLSSYIIATKATMAKCPRIMLVGGGDTPTDFVPIYASPDVRTDNRKILIQGQIYIYRAGKVFDLTGHTIY